MRKAGIGREMYAKMLAKIVACNFAELRVESPPLQNLLCFSGSSRWGIVGITSDGLRSFQSFSWPSSELNAFSMAI